MFDIWKNLKDLVRVNYRHVRTTNVVFHLHSKLTVIILIGLSVLVTSRQYLGDPIDCVCSADIKSIADKYCWVHSTFTRGRLDNEGRWGYEAVEESELPQGIRPAVEYDDERIYHTYYQWVWAVLFIQGGAFYIPYWLWKMFDRGRIKLLVSDLNLRVLSDEEQVMREKAAILRYFSPNKGHHTLYAWQYVSCEVMNLLNVLGQMWWTNVFLNYEFSTYGLSVFSLSQEKPYMRQDRLAKVFPIMTACRLATGGPAFNSIEYDLLCVLPINILNEKIYIFLWFWFVILASLSFVNILWRIVLIFIPPIRNRLLLYHVRMESSARYQLLEDLHLSYGDWFVLYKIGDNLNPIVFSELLQELIESETRDEEKKRLTKYDHDHDDSSRKGSMLNRSGSSEI